MHDVFTQDPNSERLFSWFDPEYIAYLFLFLQWARCCYPFGAQFSSGSWHGLRWIPLTYFLSNSGADRRRWLSWSKRNVQSSTNPSSIEIVYPWLRKKEDVLLEAVSTSNNPWVSISDPRVWKVNYEKNIKILYDILLDAPDVWHTYVYEGLVKIHGKKHMRKVRAELLNLYDKVLYSAPLEVKNSWRKARKHLRMTLHGGIAVPRGGQSQ